MHNPKSKNQPPGCQRPESNFDAGRSQTWTQSSVVLEGKNLHRGYYLIRLRQVYKNSRRDLPTAS